MKKAFLLVLFLLVNTLSFSQSAASKPSANYGYSPEDPILVGTEDLKEGPANEKAYLDLITGPNGEEVMYERTGSCCEFETGNSPLGSGLLDQYELRYEGLVEPVTLYLNMYDPDPDGNVQAPKGFKLKKN